MDKSTEVKLSLITKKAEEDHKLKFTSLIHLLNDQDYLYECFCKLKRGKAAGIDSRTKESYTETEIRQAIAKTVQQLKTRKYYPQPVRRVYIPKGKDKLRPLGIPTVMDKIIQFACTKILESIFEPLFLNASYGYRPERNAHQALKEVNNMLMGQKVNWVIDADIKAFFDNVNHNWMIEGLKQRIVDPNFLNLILRMLKAGVIAEKVYTGTEQGTPQGGIISPILANIYLHYVLDLWFEKKHKPTLKGYAGCVRYADDFVIGCQYPEEAQKTVQAIQERFAKFGLALAQDKTRVIEFGRFAKERRAKAGKGKPETFNFLGFTHYCSNTRKGTFAVRHRASREKYRNALKSMNRWLRAIRNQKSLPLIWRLLAIKLSGHYQYYGISGNAGMIQQFYYQTERMAFKWFNRRSQKKTWNWEQYHKHLQRYPLPKPKIVYPLYHFW